MRHRHRPRLRRRLLLLLRSAPPDQIAIAAEYEEYGIEGTWPCTDFTDAVTTHGRRGENVGVHGHVRGYMNGKLVTGSGDVQRLLEAEGVTGFATESDWRCPRGNAALGRNTSSQHIRGLAGDFYADNFNDDVAQKMMEAARQTSAGYAYVGPPDKAYVHIDWGPKRGDW